VIPEDRTNIEATFAGSGAQILPAAEAASCTGDDHRSHRATRSGLAERIGDLVKERRRDRIEHLRTVEGQRQHPVVDAREELRVGHRRCFCGHSRRTLRRRVAELAEPLIRVDAGVVPIGPHRIEAVCTNQRDVGELILSGMELRVRAEAATVAGLAFASSTRARAPEHSEGNVLRGTVRPLDQERAMLLVVVEAHGSEIHGHGARTDAV